VKFLVEASECDINRRDEFNSVPLFYACLCGHTSISFDLFLQESIASNSWKSGIVQYLLENGAKFEPGRYDAERWGYVLTYHYQHDWSLFKTDVIMQRWMRIFWTCWRTTKPIPIRYICCPRTWDVSLSNSFYLMSFTLWERQRSRHISSFCLSALIGFARCWGWLYRWLIEAIPLNTYTNAHFY